jgi:pyrophosphatase PpaX
VKHYQYVLLDWDGNLAKTLDVWLVAARTVLASRNVNPDDTTIGATFGRFHDAFPALGITDPDAVAAEIVQIAADRLPDAELYPDALEVLEYLHQAGKQLALVTTSSQKALGPLLRKYHLDEIFSTIITGDDVTHFKPHPEPLEKALEALGGTKDQAIMIGDTEKDVGCANNFGIDSILFMPPEHAKYYDFEAMLSHKPTFAVTDFRKIMEIII